MTRCLRCGGPMLTESDGVRCLWCGAEADARVSEAPRVSERNHTLTAPGRHTIPVRERRCIRCGGMFPAGDLLRYPPNGATYVCRSGCVPLEGYVPPAPRVMVRPARSVLVVEYARAGYRTPPLAEQYGVGRRTILDWLHAYDIPVGRSRQEVAV